MQLTPTPAHSTAASCSEVTVFSGLSTPSALENKNVPEVNNVMSPNIGRRFFDQRLQSSVSPQKQTHSETGLLSYQLDAQSPNLNWARLRKMSDYIKDNEPTHGKPTMMIVSDIRVAVATDKNIVYVFGLKSQQIEHVVTSHAINPLVSITSVAFSFDSLYVVVGYSDGHINLWDLNKINNPIITVKPVSNHEIEHNGSHFVSGHQEGTPVRHLEFVRSRHTAFISADHRGMILLHNGSRSLWGFYCNTKVLRGEYSLDDRINSKNSILSYQSLPLGVIAHDSDNLQLSCFLKKDELVVVSINSGFQTQFKIPIPDIESTVSSNGCVFWFPVRKSSDTKVPKAPSVAFARSTILSIVDISIIKHKNEFDDIEYSATYINKREHKFDQTIAIIKSFNSDVIFVMTYQSIGYFLSRNDLRVLKTFDLSNRNILYAETHLGRSFNQSLMSFKSNIFLLDQKGTISYANLSNWADLLVDLINKEKYIEALNVSTQQFLGHTDLLLIGLPENDSVRHNMVKVHVVQIFKAFMNSLSDKPNVEEASKILHFSFSVLVTIEADMELYDLLFEIFTNNGLSGVFFEELQKFILDSKIHVLSPTILKSMVEYFFEKGDAVTLERLICLLDITQLDIDLTLNICETYHMNDTLSFIWTVILDDYLTPIIYALKKIKKLNETKDLSMEEKDVLTNDVLFVYPYISFTLTGRQYPTEDLLRYDRVNRAKENVYYLLFSGSAISWPSNTPKFHMVEDYQYESAFPYINALLKFNSKLMMASLNEAFEDESLNEDELDFHSLNSKKYQLTVNRQYIVDILLSMFNDTEFHLAFIDKVYISIFISRNYPKYPQFIKLAGSIMSDLVMIFCKVGKIFHSKLGVEETLIKYAISLEDYQQLSNDLIDDCELSLQALLSIYKLADIKPLLIEIEDAKYYNAMITVYKSENMYYKIIELWIKLKQESLSSKPVEQNPFLNSKLREINVNGIFQSIPNMVQNALTNTTSPKKKNELITLIGKNFDLFVTSDPKGMANVIALDYPLLSKEINKVQDFSSKFKFLREVFELNSHGKTVDGSIGVDYKLKYEYVKSLLQEIDYCLANGKDYTQSKLDLEKFVMGIEKMDDNVHQLLLASNIGRNILVNIFARDEKFNKAFDLLVESIYKTKDEILQTGLTSENENLLQQLFSKCFLITESSRESLNQKTSEFNLTLKETLILKTVELSVEIYTETKDSEFHDFFKKLVIKSFRYITSIGQSDTKSFSNILEMYMNRSSVKITRLGDMRMVLNEVFSSTANDEIIMTLIKKLVEADIFDDLELIQSLKLKGWTPSNTECEICGKNIWGSQMNEAVYEIWNNHQLEKVGLITEESELLKSDYFKMCIFQCKHGYHTKCLEGMGINDKKVCIVCESNPQ